MKKTIVMGVCLAAFSFGCQQQDSSHSGMKKAKPTQHVDDQNYQDRRREMKQSKSRANGGCCGLEAPAAQGETAVAPEVKVETSN